MNTFARYISRDRRVVRLSGDLVDLVDIDNARLRLVDVVITLLQQLLNDVFDVFANVTGLGQRRRVGNRERYIQKSRQGLGEQRFAATGGAY